MNRNHFPCIIQALIAALLFGASAPLAKLLLGEIEPVPLAAFLYLGSGLGLLCMKIYQRVSPRATAREAQVKKSDLIWLAGAVFAGGVAAPIILLFSLKNTPAATASLLLNFEGAATTVIAAVAFKESISRRAWWAIALITLSGIFLSININAGWGLSLGTFGIIAACFLWGMDNNFTRNISAKDPLTIVMIKGVGAGLFSLAIALILGFKFPALRVILVAMLLGSLSYGASIVLFILAMRGLGAARTSMVFGSAPLAGMLLSFLLFREFPNWMFFLALPLMVIGTLLLVNEQHQHTHVHESSVHEHSHTHADVHHEHGHAGQVAQAHTHLHKHDQLIHTHDHMPDLHHRHTHPKDS
jgi:drug/metabolite transporter (DMT)-like permease